ncbi:MAG: hypothetical protein OK474_05085 [Thaumarchaeota archaeon]|nr:hypothetical protein [Nitrososphaerota archaeon]
MQKDSSVTVARLGGMDPPELSGPAAWLSPSGPLPQPKRNSTPEVINRMNFRPGSLQITNVIVARGFSAREGQS